MVDITDITTGTKNGTGHFDKMMDAINVHIQDQFTKGYITNKDYATVYLGALQSALQQAVAYVGIQEQVAASSTKTAAEAALLAQKLITERSQTEDVIDTVTVLGAVGKQKELQQAQINGFTRDAEQKALKILMDSWNVSRAAIGDALEIPDGARNDDIEEVIIKVRQGIGVTDSIYKFSADAGPDQDVALEAFVQLDGSGSTSPFDDTVSPESISTYLWTLLDDTTGETPVLSDTGLAKPTFNAPTIAGTLVWRLEITGTLGSLSQDLVTINVS